MKIRVLFFRKWWTAAGVNVDMIHTFPWIISLKFNTPLRVNSNMCSFNNTSYKVIPAEIPLKDLMLLLNRELSNKLWNQKEKRIKQ